nr:hypothetical protein [uncultured Acetatifactor sp.]
MVIAINTMPATSWKGAPVKEYPNNAINSNPNMISMTFFILPAALYLSMPDCPFLTQSLPYSGLLLHPARTRAYRNHPAAAKADNINTSAALCKQLSGQKNRQAAFPTHLPVPRFLHQSIYDGYF